MHKPSVLFINRAYPPEKGATGRMLHDLAAGFVQDGWDVTVVTAGESATQEVKENITVCRVSHRPGRKTAVNYGLVWLRLCLSALRQPRHDLVVSMTDPPMLAVAGSLAARLRKSRHIHWCQDVYPELLPILGYELPDFINNWFEKIAQRALKGCDRIVVIGRCMARGMIHRGIDSRLISVIPNWPDTELVRHHVSAVGEALRTVVRPMSVRPPESLFRDSRDMKFRVLYAGTLGRAHPVETVLGAAQILQQSHPDIEFVFVGDGPQFERLSSERARRRLDNIRLLPWQPADRLSQLMESGDVHLVTMRHDAAGLLVPCKIYSALAARRPAILVGPEHGEAARMLLDFNAGTVVPQGEPAQLADAIRRFREDSAVWFAAQDGARKAGEIFLPEESIRAWIERARTTIGLPAMPAKQMETASPQPVDDVRHDRAA